VAVAVAVVVVVAAAEVAEVAEAAEAAEVARRLVAVTRLEERQVQIGLPSSRWLP
jgi:hypothetical protein